MSVIASEETSPRWLQLLDTQPTRTPNPTPETKKLYPPTPAELFF